MAISLPNDEQMSNWVGVKHLPVSVTFQRRAVKLWEGIFLFQ